jgi:hypothetical protein
MAFIDRGWFDHQNFMLHRYHRPCFIELEFELELGVYGKKIARRDHELFAGGIRRCILVLVVSYER